jgi:hypothetical protein
MLNVPRKAKRMLSGEQKYDLWLRMLTGQITTAEAASESGVDRSTIMTVRRVARDAAVAALSVKPGQRRIDRAEQSEVVRLQSPAALTTATCHHDHHQPPARNPQLRSEQTAILLQRVRYTSRFGRCDRVGVSRAR